VTTPVVYQYQQALDEFRREGREPPLLKRMSELISLLDLTTTLGSSLSPDEILDAALLIVMGELQVARGALYVAEGEAGFRRRASRGLPPGAPDWLPAERERESTFSPEPGEAGFAAAGLALVCPVRRAGRTIALLGLGPRADHRPFGREEAVFLESLAACAATPIENGLIYEELRRVNRSLSVKVFQLNNLFDIGRELTASLDEEAIERLVTTTVMGQFLATRSALYRTAEKGGLRLVQSRGLRPGEAPVTLPAGLEEPGTGPSAVKDLPAGPLRDALEAARFALAVPLATGGRAEGLLVVGQRASGEGYGEEDLDYAAALARQTQAALEGAHLHRVRLAKERQDRELQIAREIQQTLLPKAWPPVPGFEIAAKSRSCYEVGGDYYDVIPLEGGKLALVIADVSGKGTPASLLMASVHASLQAMAGTESPVRLLERLNRFLNANTQASRYVTLFYAELDPARRSLVYVDAGHVPPYLRRKGGEVERLRTGGPVLGLLEDIALEAGELSFGPGDLLTAVTDGVTEAVDPGGEEFGDGRVVAALERSAGKGADAALDGLIAAVDDWTGVAGCSDDLTVLTVGATG
jgi:sigma-B regulation protein RsbU (phosphoserine phosphatase)